MQGSMARLDPASQPGALVSYSCHSSAMQGPGLIPRLAVCCVTISSPSSRPTRPLVRGQAGDSESMWHPQCTYYADNPVQWIITPLSEVTIYRDAYVEG